MPTHINNNKNAEIDLEIKNKFLLQTHLSSQEILAMLGFCRSRDSMPEPESLGLHLPRKMVLCTERKVVETTRGLDSTATLEMMAKLILSNTLLESMDSESLEEITFPAVDKPLPTTRM